MRRASCVAALRWERLAFPTGVAAPRWAALELGKGPAASPQGSCNAGAMGWLPVTRRLGGAWQSSAAPLRRAHAITGARHTRGWLCVRIGVGKQGQRTNAADSAFSGQALVNGAGPDWLKGPTRDAAGRCSTKVDCRMALAESTQKSANFVSTISASAAQPISRTELGSGWNCSVRSLPP
jgi:hypothetical protein